MNPEQQNEEWGLARQIGFDPFRFVLTKEDINRMISQVANNGYMISLLHQEDKTEELVILASKTIPEEDWPRYIPQIYDIRRHMNTKKAN